MEISPEEFIQLTNTVNKSVNEAHAKGVEEEEQRVKPKTLFDSMIAHAKKKNTLVDYNYEKDFKWIQIKPERDVSKGIAYVEIGFGSNGMDIDVVCVEMEG